MLRKQLTAPRTIVRVHGAASAFLTHARAADPAAVADNDALTLTLPDVDRDTPALVRALVAAGADILEVRADVPTLEELYLRLVGAPDPGVDQ
jgi:hypothetical protein